MGYGNFLALPALFGHFKHTLPFLYHPWLGRGSLEVGRGSLMHGFGRPATLSFICTIQVRSETEDLETIDVDCLARNDVLLTAPLRCPGNY